VTIDGTEFAILVGPLVPYPYSVLLEVLDVGVAIEKPEEFVDDALEMELLGGEQWETVGHAETHLIAEDALGACTCAVGLYNSFCGDSL
jgi:hypothetical protein